MATQWLTLALAVLVDRHRNYHGLADDAPAFPDFEVCRIQPEIGPRALERPGQEGVHPLVDLGAEAADLALRHPACAHGLDQIIDRARRDAVNVGFLDHGHQRLLGSPPRLEEAGEVAALPELGNLQRDPASPGIPIAVAVSVTLRFPHR